MSHKVLSVAEIFYSLQGEGPTMGVPSVFLRLAGCNLLCGGHGTDKDKKLHEGATWRCDTIEVWQKGRSMSFAQLSDELIRLHWLNKHFIITGGEPLMQEVALVEFLEGYSYLPFIEIETNGTKAPHPGLLEYVNQWNVSPKLSNSGMEEVSRINPIALKIFAKRKAFFKFVITSEDDWEEVKKIAHDHFIPHTQIWLMPGCSTREQLYKTSPIVAEICKREQVNFSSRLQIEIWNETTGV